MKVQNTLKTTILFVSIMILPLFTASCGRMFSVSNPDIEKLTAKAQQLMMTEDYEGAIARLESINDLNPDLPENHYNLGIAYYRMDEREKAIEAMEKAIELNKNLKDAYYTLAVIYEDLALEKIEELKEEKDKQKKTEAKDEIAECYQKAQDSYASYLEIIKDPKEQEKTEKKINSLRDDAEKAAGELK